MDYGFWKPVSLRLCVLIEVVGYRVAVEALTRDAYVLRKFWVRPI